VDGRALANYDDRCAPFSRTGIRRRNREHKHGRFAENRSGSRTWRCEIVFSIITILNLFLTWLISVLHDEIHFQLSALASNYYNHIENTFIVYTDLHIPRNTNCDGVHFLITNPHACTESQFFITILIVGF